MCIRDSAGIGHGKACQVDAVGDDLDPFARHAGLDDGRLEPVSYTPLRAHETVLDLVCRLLLEKKTRHIRVEHDHMESNN